MAGSQGDRSSPNTVQSVPGSSCQVSVPTAPASELTAVGAVMYTADDLDEIVHTRFGGKRYADPLE